MEELTRMRNEVGWTQQKLAEESGVDKSTINQIERGRRSPNIETLEKLVDAMGREMGDLFPLGQAPLWSGDSPTERRDIYAPWIEFINIYADRWEAKIAAGTLDRGTVSEFAATCQNLFQVLQRLEAQEKQAQPIIREAVDRLLELVPSISETGDELVEELPLTQLRRQREEMASEQNWAANG